MRIAAFDSGVGGLTALAPLFKKYKNLDVTFLGDRANLPYGTKSPDIIKELVSKNIEWLLKQQPADAPFDFLIVACNTASAHALELTKTLAAKHNIPVVGVIEPGSRAALEENPERIVILGTHATVQAGAYLSSLLSMGYKFPVIQKACPLFVPFVEENILTGPALEWICHEYLDYVLKKNDTVILGCTHYPFLVPTLSRLFPHQQWIDAGASLLKDPELQKCLANDKVKATTSKLTLLFTDKIMNETHIHQTLSSLGLSKIPTTVQTLSF